MKRTASRILPAILITILSSSAIRAQYAVERYVFGIGGIELKNAQNHIVGTLGQTLIGVTSNTANTKKIGFWYGVHSVPVGIAQEPTFPDGLSLGQNFPNPVAGMASIPFSCTHGGYVQLSIVNILGEPIRTLVEEEMRPGSYRAAFDATYIPGGVYFYRLRTSKGTITRTLVVRK